MNMNPDQPSSYGRSNGNGNGYAGGYRDDEHEIRVRPGGTTAGMDTAGPVQDASVGSLLRELAHEVPSLLTKEMALAKEEMRENMRETREGVTAVAAGGAVALAGLIFVLTAAVYALANVMAPWLAALLVGVAALVVGYAMVQGGKHKFSASSMKPDRTVDSLRKDKNAIRGGVQ